MREAGIAGSATACWVPWAPESPFQSMPSIGPTLSASPTITAQSAAPAEPPRSSSFRISDFTGGGIGIRDLEVNSNSSAYGPIGHPRMGRTRTSPVISRTERGYSGDRMVRKSPGQHPWGMAPTSPSRTASRTSYGRDLGLQARMLATMVMLGLLYLALVGVLLWAGIGAIAMLFVVAGLALAQLFLSDKLALRAMGAHEVSPSEAPGLHALVERLCVQADLAKPKIAIADTARSRTRSPPAARARPRPSAPRPACCSCSSPTSSRASSRTSWPTSSTATSSS